MMPSSSFRLAGFAACILSYAYSVRHDQDGIIAVNQKEPQYTKAPAPETAVEKGLTRATEYADELYKASLKAHQDITASIATDAEAGKNVTEDYVHQLNRAIKQSISARALKSMVNEHVSLTKKFFTDVGNFQKNKAQMKTVEEHEKAKQDAEKATTAEAMQLAQDNMKKAAEKLAQEHHDQEISSLGSLLDIWGRLQETHTQIEQKDALLKADVHEVVHEGTSAVEQWANGELQHVCDKFLASERPEVQAAKEQLSGSGELVAEGKLLDATSLCGAMMKQLAA